MALTLRGIDATGGAVLAGPLAQTIEYTTRNMQVRPERETRDITIDFANALRRAIQ